MISVAANLIEAALAASVLYLLMRGGELRNEGRVAAFLSVILIADLTAAALFATGASVAAHTDLYVWNYVARFTTALFVVIRTDISLGLPLAFSAGSIAAVLWTRAEVDGLAVFITAVVALNVFYGAVAVGCGRRANADLPRARYFGFAAVCLADAAAQVMPRLLGGFGVETGLVFNLLAAELVGGALLLMAFLYSNAQREGGWSPMQDASPLKHWFALIDIETLRRRLPRG